MQEEVLQDTVVLAERVGHVFLATASGDAVPDLAAAGELTSAGEGQVVVDEWFFPGTMDDLEDNGAVAVVAWDAKADTGHHLVGRVVDTRERSVVDGYLPEMGEERPPQVERELVVQVDRVLRFSQGPHRDVPAQHRGQTD